MDTNQFVTNVRNDMYSDSGIGNDEQQIWQITWILFLKVYHARELHWELNDENYKSIIAPKYQWDNWAKNTKKNWNKTGDKLIHFVNDELIPYLQHIPYNKDTPNRKSIVPKVFSHVHNQMNNGYALRKVLNEVDALNLINPKGNDVVADIYEKILHQMQADGNSDEYYTPRPLTNFIADHLDIKLGDTIGDFAVGTGGFLTSALRILRPQVKTAKDWNTYSNCTFGQELHFLPYLLCVTNLFLHGVDNPKVVHHDSLTGDITHPDEQFDRIAMNPPYAATKLTYNNFPYDFRTKRLADLFVVLVMYRLKLDGKAGIVLPDSFMFDTSAVMQRIKAHLLNNFNVKYIVRLPKGVFNPYTSINTNIVFFDNDGSSTKNIWFYRIDLPKGMKQFTKTRPIAKQSFDRVNKWMQHPTSIGSKDDKKAEQVSIDQIKKRKYDLSYVGFGQKHTVIKDPMTLLNEYLTQKHQYDQKISKLTKEVKDIFGSNDKND